MLLMPSFPSVLCDHTITTSDTTQGLPSPMSPSDSKPPHDISTRWPTGILGSPSYDILVFSCNHLSQATQKSVLSSKSYCHPYPHSAPHIKCAIFCKCLLSPGPMYSYTQWNYEHPWHLWLPLQACKVAMGVLCLV